jgi:hypothetical protein
MAQTFFVDAADGRGSPLALALVLPLFSSPVALLASSMMLILSKFFLVDLPLFSVWWREAFSIDC